MTWKRILFGVGMPIIAVFMFVSPVKAEQVKDGTLKVLDSKVFYLDRGFIGRSVSLDLLGGKANVSWDAEDLKAPTILYVAIEKTTTSSVNGVLLGDETVHLIWSDPYLLSERGVKVSYAGISNNPWKESVIYKQDGENWKEAVDGRVYGHARARSAQKPSSYMREGDASWYKYKNCRCAASVDFPKGTHVLVRRLDKPEKFTVVRINDYGPERDKFPERAIDLDAVAFAELASLRAGVIEVSVEPLTPDDPLYAMADCLPSSIATAIQRQ
ncbi:MAG: RlpA-like double-psi beta-barrel domain-containing protein [Patescibacteria group bacterium]